MSARFGFQQSTSIINQSARNSIFNNRNDIQPPMANNMRSLSSMNRSVGVDVMGTDYISCPTHPNYFITNMCVAQECNEPICPECIHDHLQLHIRQGDEPQVENIQNIRVAYRQKSEEYMSRLVIDLKDVENHDLGNSGLMNDKYVQYSLKQLEEAKRKAINLVEEVFDQHEQQIRQKLSRQYNLEHEFKEVRNHIQNEFNKIQMLLQDFQSPTEYVKAIIYSIDKQIGRPGNSILEELEAEIKHYESQLPEVVVDVRALDDVYNALQNYIQIHSQVPNRQNQIAQSTFRPTDTLPIQKKEVTFFNPFFDENQQTKQKESQLVQQLVSSSQQQNKQKEQQLVQLLVSPNSPQQQQPQLSSQYQYTPPAQKQSLTNDVYMINDMLTGLTGKKPAFSTNLEELTGRPVQSAYPPLKIENQSANAPFICTFLDDQKYGLIYHFAQNQRVEVISLELENRLPHNHGSIVVDGNAYILGGIVKDFDRNNAVSSVYRINLKQAKVQLVCNMISKRQNFGIASVGPNNIYVVGGSQTENESQGMSQFERMDITSKKWTPLSSSINRATGCTLVGFHEKFLIKFGGLNESLNLINEIEVYNIRRDNWNRVRTYDQNQIEWNQVPSQAGAIQLNRDQIFIFGGVNSSGMTDNSYLAQLDHGDDVTQIHIKKTHSLPFQSDVKGPIVVHNKKIYAFISRLDKGQALRKERVLIEGSAEGWSQMG